MPSSTSGAVMCSVLVLNKQIGRKKGKKRYFSTKIYACVIDSIEANVDNAAIHVETANVQLEKAKNYQKASRKKMCCLLVILLLAGGVVGLIVYLTTK